MPRRSDEYFMRQALAQASLAAGEGEVPVGCVVTRNDEIIASAYNRRIGDCDPTAHAEILAIRKAAKAVGGWRLDGCQLVVTLEPCCMCAGAIVLARLDRVVYGATDPKGGAVETLYEICTDQRLNHRPGITSGVLASECGSILSTFFADRRAEGRK